MHKAAAMTSELEYTILLAGDLDYFPKEVIVRLTADTVEVRKMLLGLIRAI